MPPIRRKGPKGSLVSTRIPLNAVNSVATHSDNKRMPYEASVIDNCLVSLERGVEKRPGFEILPQWTFNQSGFTWDFTNNSSRAALYNLPDNHDLFFYWYSINEDNTFLIAVDYDATGATDKLFYVYQLNADNSWKSLTPENQWDPAESTTTIPATYTAGNANSELVNAYATANSLSYANARASGVVNKDSRAYITYGTNTKIAREVLQVVALGSNLIILNNQVFAGFSSDVAGKLFGLDGVVPASPVDDIEGRPVTYYSAAKVMKVYDKGDDATAGTSDDILLGWKPGIITGQVATATTVAGTSITLTTTTALPTTSFIVGSTLKIGAGSYTISGCTASSTASQITVTTSTNIPATAANTTYTIEISGSAYVPAGDYYYYKSDYAYLGQRVTDISGVRLPPENDDWFATNYITGDTKAQQMLKALYDSESPYKTYVNGRGKIYLAINPYLNSTSGYYRVISFPEGSTYTFTPDGGGSSVTVNGSGRPYLQKIRTPDEHSYIDPRRMPQKLQVNITVSGASGWSIDKIKWSPRTTGDKKTNPGPSIFKKSDGTLQQVQIKSLAVFKNRLWFSANDVVFSTRSGQFENLFLNDPSNILTSDPIDIRASSNQYAEISSMLAFDDFLFIDTKAKTQFQLMSSSTMELSPTNVVVSPSTFYSTAPITLPQLMGSRLYFFGPQRLYMFIGKNNLGYSGAIEASSSAAGYLPINYRSLCTAPAQDSIIMVSEENPNQIYLNTTRFSGERVIQNSFYRYVLDTGIDIKNVQVYKNYLYAVVKTASNYYLMRSYMMNEATTVPRMDKMLKIKLKTGAGGNVAYDTTTRETTFSLPRVGYNQTYTRVVLADGWTSGGEDISGTILAEASFEETLNFVGPSYDTFKVKGDYETGADGKYIYVGEVFESRVTLSTLFVRDENNNIIDGVLNLRTGVFRHFNTGNYDIQVTHRGRSPLVSKFNAAIVDFTTNEDTMPLQTTQNQGEFVAKIYGYSDSTKISIVSTYTTPMNITNMEFKGKFKQKYTTLN